MGAISCGEYPPDKGNPHKKVTGQFLGPHQGHIKEPHAYLQKDNEKDAGKQDNAKQVHYFIDRFLYRQNFIIHENSFDARNCPQA
jgi:hypothetical protein